jgi:hypothetical protein
MMRMRDVVWAMATRMSTALVVLRVRASDGEPLLFMSLGSDVVDVWGLQ